MEKRLFIQDGHLNCHNMSMLSRKALISLFCMLVVQFGCSVHAGLNRTPLGDNFRFNYPSIGISILLPVQPENRRDRYRVDLYDSDVFRENAKLQGEIYFGFHPIYGSHPMSEPDYLVDINTARFSIEQFELFKQGSHYLLADPCYQKMTIELSTSIKEREVYDKFNNKDYRCFMKTMVFENGDVLVSSGRLLLTGDLYTGNDISFIRDTIDSVVVEKK